MHFRFRRTNFFISPIVFRLRSFPLWNLFFLPAICTSTSCLCGHFSTISQKAAHLLARIVCVGSSIRAPPRVQRVWARWQGRKAIVTTTNDCEIAFCHRPLHKPFALFDDEGVGEVDEDIEERERERETRKAKSPFVCKEEDERTSIVQLSGLLSLALCVSHVETPSLSLSRMRRRRRKVQAKALSKPR